MNKFLTEIDGGLPLRLNDARWLESANAEMFEAIVKTLLGLNKTQAKLYNCEVVDTEQGDVYYCPGGFIFFDNEIFYVEPVNVTHSSNNLIFVPDITYETEGDKIFKNSVQHSTYQRRKAKLVSVATLPSSYADAYADDFITILKGRLGNSDWYTIPLTLTNMSTSGSGAITSVSGTIRRKIDGTTVYLVIEADIELDSYLDDIQIYLSNKVKGSIETSVMLYNLQAYGTKSPYLRMSAEATTFTESNLVIRSPFTDTQIASGSYKLRGQLFYETF